MSAGDNPRFVVTSLAAPTPQMLYEDLYCARGNCENEIKAVKCDLQSDRTSATTFLANSMRLLLAWVAYLRLADKYLGLLASRLRGVNQPVIRTRRGFQPLVTHRWPAFERKVSAPNLSPPT